MASFEDTGENLSQFFLPYFSGESLDEAITDYYVACEEEKNEILLHLGEKRCTDPMSFAQEETIGEVVTFLFQSFENGIVSDDILIQCIQANDYYFLVFLLMVVCKFSFDHIFCRQAVHCLIHVCNIHEQVWNEFLENFYSLKYHRSMLNDSEANHHLHLLVEFIESLLQKLVRIQNFEYPKLTEEVYMGYDARDQADYHTEGYFDLEAEKKSILVIKESHEHLVEVFLMVLYQIFSVRNDTLMIKIEENRLDVQSEKKIESQIISRLLQMTEQLLSFSRANRLANHETVSQQCVRIIILISSQFPLLNFKTTEVADSIVLMDGNKGGGMYAQAILEILNENGFPNMNRKEAFAAIRFCINVFYSEANALLGEIGLDQTAADSTGNFYVNDIKVLLEVCLRELVNIPVEADYWELRLRYMELVEAILVKGDWKRACDSYRKKELIEVLQEIKLSDAEQNQLFAEDLLSQHLRD